MLNQDYAGSIEITVLIEDSEDTSFIELNQRFRLNHNNEYKQENRLLKVNFTRLKLKNDKLNYALEGELGNFVAVFDADHRAHPKWISTSLDKMHEQKADAIQGVRAALDTRQTFKFWDSAENHLGNEVFNKVFARWGLSGFFTGTTCVFKAEAFKDKYFPDSITEDTYLSYSLILKGSKIAYNGAYGSYEEVSPDLSTYINRRRRWSCGHNQTFFDHFKKILSSPLSIANKLQLLFHGAYFLIPALIVLVLNCFGLFYFFQLTQNVQLFSLLVTAILSLLLNLLVSNTLKQYSQNLFFTFLWVFPQIAVASVFVYKFSRDELYFQIISFPFLGEIAWLHFILILLPLVVLAVGSLKLKRPSFRYFLFYLPTFPVILFLDIYALYLGLVDYILKRNEWGKIRRSHFIDDNVLPGAILPSLRMGQTLKTRYWIYIFLPITIFCFVIAHDLLVFDNCGHPDYIFGKPIIYEKKHYDPELDIQIRKSRSDANGYIKVDAEVKLSNEDRRTINLEYGFSDGLKEKQTLNDHDIHIIKSFTAPYGFEEKSFQTHVQAENESCFLEVSFSTKLVDILNGRLQLNAEPFLIKGIIPSFRTASINLGLKDGLEQIKSIGANAIRMYHTPTDETLDLAKELQLLVISQPDETTWLNINMDVNNSNRELVEKYKDHIRKTSNSPYILFDHLGNELEVFDSESKSIQNIKLALKQARASAQFRYPLSYSTYKVYEKFPVDILGVNMLDTGATYWEKGLSLMKENNQSFYASEFGGFVAFFERTAPLLRARRIADFWNQILDNNGSGAVFFQSHDNWAQPVFSGYNDPFNPEQPDDLRGLWDHKNEEKFILKHLRRLYSDFDVKILEQHLQLTNRRDYKITGLSINGEFIGNLEPQESAKVSGKFTSEPIVQYMTHSGLKSRYHLPMQFSNGTQPAFENDFVYVEENNGTYKGLLAKNNILEFTLPASWNNYQINGQLFKNKERNNYRFESQSHLEIPKIQWRTQHSDWSNFDKPIKGSGNYEIRMKLPNIKAINEYFIIFDGLGSLRLIVNQGERADSSFKVHNYREQRIALKDLQKSFNNGWLSFSINRNATGFVHPKYTADGKMISIDFQKPYLEKIHDFKLSKHN